MNDSLWNYFFENAKLNCTRFIFDNSKKIFQFISRVCSRAPSWTSIWILAAISSWPHWRIERGITLMTGCWPQYLNHRRNPCRLMRPKLKTLHLTDCSIFMIETICSQKPYRPDHSSNNCSLTGYEIVPWGPNLTHLEFIPLGMLGLNASYIQIKCNLTNRWLLRKGQVSKSILILIFSSYRSSHWRSSCCRGDHTL